MPPKLQTGEEENSPMPWYGDADEVSPMPSGIRPTAPPALPKYIPSDEEIDYLPSTSNPTTEGDRGVLSEVEMVNQKIDEIVTSFDGLVDRLRASISTPGVGLTRAVSAVKALQRVINLLTPSESVRGTKWQTAELFTDINGSSELGASLEKDGRKTFYEVLGDKRSWKQDKGGNWQAPAIEVYTPQPKFPGEIPESRFNFCWIQLEPNQVIPALGQNNNLQKGGNKAFFLPSASTESDLANRLKEYNLPSTKISTGKFCINGRVLGMDTRFRLVTNGRHYTFQSQV